MLRKVPLDLLTGTKQEYLDFLEVKHKEDVLDVLAKGTINDEVKKIYQISTIA